MDSRIVLLEQFTSAFFTDHSSQLVEQICIIRNCYCTFLCKKVQHNNALCIPKYSCHHLVSRGLRFELLWPRRPRPYTLATLSFILWLIIMDPGLIYSQKSSSFDLNRFNNALYTDALVAICSSLRDFGTQRAISLCIPKRSCKVVETLPCEMCNAFAVSST